ARHRSEIAENSRYRAPRAGRRCGILHTRGTPRVAEMQHEKSSDGVRCSPLALAEILFSTTSGEGPGRGRVTPPVRPARRPSLSLVAGRMVDIIAPCRTPTW